MEQVVWVQHEDLKENSYLFIDDQRVFDLDSIEAREAIQLLINNKGLLKIIDCTKSHPRLKEIKSFKNRYLITGTLLSADEKNRKMTYNYLFFRRKLKKSQVKQYLIRIVEEEMKKEIEYDDIDEAISIIQKKKDNNRKIVIVLGVIAIIVLILIFLIDESGSYNVR